MVGAVVAWLALVSGRRWAKVRAAWRPLVLSQLTLDVRALALMRISLAACVIGDMAGRWGDIEALYADEGVVAPVASPWARSLFPLYDLFGAPEQVRVWMLLTAAAALLVGLGLGTRVSSLVCWWLLGALHVRNGAVLQDGDHILHQLLLISVMLPCGARWSMDARRRAVDAVAPKLCAGPATALVIGQMMLIYIMAGITKMRFAHWWLGDGVAYGLQADHFVTPIGVWLRASGLPLAPLSLFTILLEVCGPIIWLVAPPGGRWRSGVVISFMALHTGIALTIHVGLFSYVCLSLWLFAIPTHWLDALEAKAGRVAGAGRVASAPQSGALRALCSVFLVYLLAATFVNDVMRRKPPPKAIMARAFLVPAARLAIKLQWAVFSGPRKKTGWYLAWMQDGKGRRVDLHTGQTLNFARPDNVLASFPNQRWRKLWVNFRKGYAAGLLRNYMNMLCRVNPEARLVELTYMERDVRLDGTIPKARPKRIGRQRCTR